MTSKQGSVKRGIVSSDLLEERSKLDFDQEELREFLHGGPIGLESVRSFTDLFGADPDLANNLSWNDLTRGEQQEDHWKRIKKIYENHGDRFFKNFVLQKFPQEDWYAYFQGLPPVGMHVTMFKVSFENLASEEQKKYWIPKMNNLDVLGCYAQTELGHGSNVAELETTATFDQATDEIVINSPTLTSTKYWPGDLGRFTSHALIFGQLKVGKKNCGIQAFLVPLRDLETWKHLPGVKTGDLGPKIGYSSKDNGWASFDHVRIPRSYMMMGIVNLSREGKLTRIGDPRVLYTVMSFIRMHLVKLSASFTTASSQIAARYCCVRRQFSTQEGTREERKVIDYQTTSFTMAKLISNGLCNQVVSNWIVKAYYSMLEGVKQKDYSLMDSTHHCLAGLKATITFKACDHIELARRTCGGAGYQTNAGFTQIYDQVSPYPTFEGDNVVMLGQASRYLMKLIKQVSDGKKVPFPFTYLNNMQSTLAKRNQARTVDDFCNLDLLDEALQARACNQISSTMRDYSASTASAKVKDNDLFYQAKVNMTKAHLKYLQFHLFRKSFESQQFQDPRNVKVMELVGRTYALFELLDDSSSAYDSGFLAPGSLRAMQQAAEKCVAEMRPHFIPLAETPYLPDHIVPSVIGNSFGDIYEQQLECAQNSRLNVNNEVPEYFERLMKPILRPKL